MISTEILILLITNIIAPIITGTVTWFQAKKKYNSEVDANVIANMKQSLEFYQSLSDDTKKRLDTYVEKNMQLEQEMSELRKQMLTLTMNICLDLTCKHRILEQKKEVLKEDSNADN